MSPIVFFVILAFIATVAMLMAGGISMVKGGKYDLAHSIELMEG